MAATGRRRTSPVRRPGQRATSRDPGGYARATKEARAVRERVAAEVAATIANQVYDLLVEGDIMGGRSRVASALREIVSAEQGGDRGAVRAAVMDGVVAHAAWVAALDWREPSELDGGGSG